MCVGNTHGSNFLASCQFFLRKIRMTQTYHYSIPQKPVLDYYNTNIFLKTVQHGHESSSVNKKSIEVHLQID